MPYLKLLRLDHWIKNLFILPGVVLAWHSFHWHWSILFGVLACCLMSSSNYVLNEILDAETDIHHPIKCRRPIPSGAAKEGHAYMIWIALYAIGFLIGHFVNVWFSDFLIVLWLMGIAYNAPTIRLKDRPYLDILSESFNNPIRMCLGWYLIMDKGFPPISLLISYWAFGAFLMTLKRYSEMHDFYSQADASKYRKSFSRYTATGLESLAMLFTSIAVVLFYWYALQQSVNWFWTFPIMMITIVYYHIMALELNSAVQHPEKLWREKGLMILVVVNILVGIFCVEL